MIRLEWTPKDQEEFEELIAKHPRTVVPLDADRFTAQCKLLVENGAIYWRFLVRDGQYQLVKTRHDDDAALVFQSAEVYRLAWLWCKLGIVLVRAGHTRRNEQKAADPNRPVSKKTTRLIERVKQGTLPLELHTHVGPRKTADVLPREKK